MLHDVAAAMERCEHIDKTKHLDLEMFVAHRERHHALIETGFAKKGFGMPIDELKNALAAPLDFALNRIHVAKINPATSARQSQARNAGKACSLDQDLAKRTRSTLAGGKPHELTKSKTECVC